MQHGHILQEAGQLFSPPVEDDNLNEFMWAHIARDLRCLAAALNRSEEEALLTVHCVLHHMAKSCGSMWLYFVYLFTRYSLSIHSLTNQ